LEGKEPSVVNYRGKVRRMGLEREGLVAIVFENMSDTETARLRECVMKRALSQIIYLSQFPAFRDLSDLDLLALTSVCHELHLKSGVHVAKFGDEADSVFLIKRGAVRLLSPQSPDGETEPTEVEVARAGQLFGEASALLKLPHNLDVVAIEDTELLLIPAAAMVYLRDHHPSLAVSLYEIFAAFMGRRIRRLTGRLFSPLSY
jgi:CRP-like cAMP-binding protein